MLLSTTQTLFIYYFIADINTALQKPNAIVDI